MSTTPSSSSSSTTFRLRDIPTVFNDVEPLSQVDNYGVCEIDYSDDFIIAYDYFRAIHYKHELSHRSLQLTEICLHLNPANYTVWHYRRQCLFHNNDSSSSNNGGDDDIDNDDKNNDTSNDDNNIVTKLDYDFQLAASLGGDNPKNYQIWYHRRALLEELLKETAAQKNANDDNGEAGLFERYCKQELEYLQQVAEADSKNYHAWSHRQWVVTTLDQTGIWSDELAYTNELIQQDCRNNSAWNHRWFVVSHQQRKKQQKQGSKDEEEEEASLLLRREAEYALEIAKLDPYNESPWRYFIATLRELMMDDGVNDADAETNNTDSTAKQQRLLLLNEYEQKVRNVQQVLRDAGRVDVDACPNMTSALIDILEWKNDQDSLEQVITLTQLLADKYDPIRYKYWMYRQTQTKHNLESILLSSS